MKTNKKAISLIVLVITIIVLAILAATVIITLSNTNIMEQASNAAFRSDMANYKQAASLYVTSQMAENKTGDDSNINLAPGDADYASVFGEVPSKYSGKISIVSGKLVYETEVQSEIDVLEEMGIASSTTPSGDNETETIAAGLYATGTVGTADPIKTWDELIEDGVITVEDGVLSTGYDVDSEENSSSEALAGDLVTDSSVTSIAEHGFRSCEKLTSIILNDEIISIENYAFYNVYLNTLVIPGTITTLTWDHFPSGEFGHVIIKEGFTTIDGGCFSGSTVEKITLPNSLSFIGGYAFEYELEIIYEGTQEEWEAVEKETDWDIAMEGTVIHCTDGDITIE